MIKNYYVYMIRTLKNTIYTGITTDIARRMEEHQHGENGAKYMKSSGFKQLEFVITTDGRSNASKIESYLKSLTKQEKEKFIKEPNIAIVEIKKILDIDAKLC